MLLGRTGASAINEEDRLFLSSPSQLSITFEGYWVLFMLEIYGRLKRQRFNLLSLMWECSLTTDRLISMAWFSEGALSYFHCIGSSFLS